MDKKMDVFDVLVEHGGLMSDAKQSNSPGMCECQILYPIRQKSAIVRLRLQYEKYRESVQPCTYH